MSYFEELLEKLNTQTTSQKKTKTTANKTKTTTKKKKKEEEETPFDGFFDEFYGKFKTLAEANTDSNGKSTIFTTEGGGGRHFSSSGREHGGGSSAVLTADEYNALLAEEEKKEREKREFLGLDLFQKGAWEGYEPGKVDSVGSFFDETNEFNKRHSQALLGTMGDVGLDIIEGGLNMVEGITDVAGWILYGGNKYLAKDDEAAEKIKKAVEKDSVSTWLDPADKWLEQYSVFGDSTDQVAQGVGQVGATMGIGAIGKAAGATPKAVSFLTKLAQGVSSFGRSMSEAYKSGATDGEALGYGAIAATAEVLFESLFNGMGKTAQSLGFDDISLTNGADDWVASKVSSFIKNPNVKNFVQGLVKGGFEGVEELLTGFVQGSAKKIYDDEKTWGELLKDENLWEQFFVGMLTGDIMQAGDVIKANKSGRDLITGLNADETTVVDKIVDERIAKKAKEIGKDLKGKDKAEIREQVMEDLENGNLDVDDIERILGGDSYNAFQEAVKGFEGNDTYKAYRDALAEEKALQTEFDELSKVKTTEANLGQNARFNELQQKLAELKQKSKSGELRTQLQPEIDRINDLKAKMRADSIGRLKDSKLTESYLELARSGEKFKIDDFSKYKGEHSKQTINNILASGLANNSKKMHRFVDFLAKISDAKGVTFSLADAKKLANTIHDFNGATADGFITGNEITINLDSKKKLNSIVGHEIGHVLKGTEFWDTLSNAVQRYASSKGEWDAKLAKIKETYKKYDSKADPVEEAVVDLIGEYVFTDSKFVNSLSTEHRNIFQKIYDEIKWLAKIATAGSEEKRNLVEVERIFEKAWRDSNTNVENTTKHSISESNQLTAEQEEFFKDSVVRDENGNLKPMYHGTANGGHTIFDTYGSKYGLFGAGSYFTDSKTVAEKYTDKHNERGNDKKQVYETYLNIKKPMDMDAQADPAEWARVFPEASFPESGTNEDFFRAMEDYFYDMMISKDEAADEVIDAMTAMGYDGITHIGGGRVNPNGERHRVYIAFHPEQIKNTDNVNPTSDPDIRYSISEDSDGNKLTEEQNEFFKDSKMRDDNGKLIVMYHGTQEGGFHTFDNGYSDDYISFFFTDRNEVASTYSGTRETYTAKSLRTADDFNRFFNEIGAREYSVVEENGKFKLLEDGDEIAESDTADGLYEEFRDWSGKGYGEVNYKVYLNLKNPLVVDAKGANWRSLPGINGDSFRYDYIEIVEVCDDGSVIVEYATSEDHLPVTQRVDLWWKFGDSLGDILAEMGPGESLDGAYANPSTTRDYAKYAKENGYDGVIFKNIVDNGGYSNGRVGASTVGIAFYSNQIKSVGNTNPTTNNDIRYSLTEDTKLADKAIAKNDVLGFLDSETVTLAKAMRERVAQQLRSMKENGVAIPDDIKGNTAISNSSYDITEENTTICPRSLAAESFVDAVSEYLGRPLTVEEQIYISQDLQGRSLAPECTYCYVATDRKAYRQFLGEYIKQRDAVLEKIEGNPNADITRGGELYKDFLNGRKDTDPMYKRFKMWVDAYKSGKPLIDGSHLANMNRLMGDINEFGAELKPQIVDAMKYAQSASWAKKRVSYVAYDGHILKWKQNRIDKLNSHYGLRMYSFSDFHPAFVLENMQMITDAAVRGLKVLGYTKDTDFVEIFAPSGMNINISTFGFESGGNVYENNIIGANWEKAKALREQNPNVGITFVATSDSMVEWALEQDWVDVVIPYHLVRTGEAVANAFDYKNFTNESSDTKDKGWSKDNDSKYIAPTEHNNDKATYLAALAKNNLKPRFERWLNNPNYMKLVNECRQTASESKPVQPKFNEDAINTALAKLKANGYYQPVGGSVDRMYEIAAQVAENMQTDLQSIDTSKRGWVKDLPVRNSITEDGYVDPDVGDYAVYGSDVKLRSQEDFGFNPLGDIAPVAEQNVQNTADVPFDAPVMNPAEQNSVPPANTLPPTEGNSFDAPVQTQQVAPQYTDEAPMDDGYMDSLVASEPPPAMFDAPVREDKVDQQTPQILTEEKPKAKKKPNTMHKLVELLVDKGAVFERLSKKTKNRELEAKYNYMHYSEAKAQKLIGEGDAEKGIRSLTSIAEQVGERTKDFYTYLYHILNMDRMTLRQRGFGENKAVFGSNVTAQMSSAIAQQIERANPDFRQLATEIYGINQHLRQMLVESGIITQETANRWTQMYPHYVPISRADHEALAMEVQQDTNKTGVNAPVKRATGGNGSISPLFNVMGSRILQTFKAVDKNSFGLELMRTLGTVRENSATDMDGIMDAIDTHENLLQVGEDGTPTFSVFANGQRVKFDIDKEMYDALSPTNETLAYTNKIANGISNFRRGLITEYNLVFLATNALKDAQDVLINSQHPLLTYANMPRAWAQMIGNGKWFKEYMANGGEQNSYFEKDTRTFQKEKSTFRKVVGFPLDVISYANNFIERVPRLAEYIASREHGRSIEVAMLDAARVTTNFAAGGDATKFLNRNGFTFLNASVQGATQQIRNIQEARMQGAKGWLKLAGKTILAGLPALLLNGLLWDDDDEYEELSDYVKENYYIVGKLGDGQFIRIPKGRTVAVIQEAFEQMKNLVTGEDEADFMKWANLLVSNLAPNDPMNNFILAPIIQASTNTAWHGGEIVPQSMQDVPEAEQYDESTDMLSRRLGEMTNISPMKWNYLLDQYSGGVGDVLLPMMTPEAERGGNKLASPWLDKFTTDSVLNNQNVTDFYDLKDELTIKANSSKATDDDILMSKYMSSVNSQLSELYKEKREIQNSRMSDDRKYEEARRIQEEIVDTMRSAISAHDKVSYLQDNKTGEHYAHIGGKWFKRRDGEYDHSWEILDKEETEKYLITRNKGDSNYATDGKTHYAWVEPDEDDLEKEPYWKKLTDKQVAKQNTVTRTLGITPEEYWGDRGEDTVKMYDWIYDNPEKVEMAKAVSDDFNKYWEYKTYIGTIDAKDENGKTVNGLAKRRTHEYIFNLNIDDGQKMILFRSYYPKDDTYCHDIVDYLNGRDDISYQEMKSILEALDMKLHADRTITWD